MCELFAVCGTQPVKLNDYLKEFFSHSVRHPNGWGIAYFDSGETVIDKEPLPAYQSSHLKELLEQPITAVNMMAHIRQATRGNMVYRNCHPFVQKDCTGMEWTLIHNGTIFDGFLLDQYLLEQEGETDSERILCHVIHLIDRETLRVGGPLTEEERFAVIDRAVLEMAPHNKVNMILYDGEQYYVHTNLKDTLHMKMHGSSVIFSTRPLDSGKWEDVPFMQLQGYIEGELVNQGTAHGYEYFVGPLGY